MTMVRGAIDIISGELFKGRVIKMPLVKGEFLKFLAGDLMTDRQFLELVANRLVTPADGEEEIDFPARLRELAVKMEQDGMIIDDLISACKDMGAEIAELKAQLIIDRLRSDRS